MCRYRAFTLVFVFFSIFCAGSDINEKNNKNVFIAGHYIKSKNNSNEIMYMQCTGESFEVSLCGNISGRKCIIPVTMYDRDDCQMRARRLRLFQRATVCPCFLSLRIPYYLSNKLFIQILLTCSGAGLGILPLSPLRQAETAGGFFVVIYMMRTGRSVIHTSGLMF